MKLLADTHAVLWYVLGRDALPRVVRAAFDDSDNDVFVSAASAWEITTKHRLGKLPEAGSFASDVEHHLASHGFRALPITMAHAETAGRLTGSHRDPFDRMLIAQALLENLVLVSNETRFDQFGVKRLW